MPSSARDIEVVVKAVRIETPDIRSFVLVRPDGENLPAFLAGAHVDVEPVPGLMRQYSLAGDPEHLDHYLLGVKKEPVSRGGSSAMHGAIRTGSSLRISPPKNHFTLRPTAGRSILLAGGIGITPLMSMATVLLREGRDFHLHYFTRANNDIAFRSRLADIGLQDHVTFHLGLVPPALNDLLAILLADQGPEDHVYMCGPAPFMDAVRDVGTSVGWHEERIFSEYFSAAPASLDQDGETFAIRLARDGRELSVPSDRTIIEVLRENGCEIETSCEQGICGTCVTRFLEGEPDHRDLYLSDEEHERDRLFTPCVSRSKSKLLVIDL